MRQWQGWQGLTVTSEAGSGRASALLSTPLDGAARRRQGGRRTSEWASGGGGVLSGGPYGSPGRSNRQQRPFEATMHKARSVLEPSQNQASLLHVAAQLYACPHGICVADAFRIRLSQHRTFALDWQGAGRPREARKVHFGLAQPSPGAVCALGSAVGMSQTLQQSCTHHGPELLVSGAYCRGCEALCPCEQSGVSWRAIRYHQSTRPRAAHTRALSSVGRAADRATRRGEVIFRSGKTVQERLENHAYVFVL